MLIQRCAFLEGTTTLRANAFVSSILYYFLAMGESLGGLYLETSNGYSSLNLPMPDVPASTFSVEFRMNMVIDLS